MASHEFDTYRHAIEERLSAQGAEHAEEVAGTALHLAAIYGVDRDAAAVAGLLHDWDRELSGDELLVAAARAGLAVTDADRARPRLLHAGTGAAHVRERFPEIGGDVIAAIERHTLGAPDMSPLDMVVYIADMIAPSRVFRGVDDLREAVGDLSLEALFGEAYRRSVAHVVTAGKFLHPVTVDVFNVYCVRGHS